TLLAAASRRGLAALARHGASRRPARLGPTQRVLALLFALALAVGALRTFVPLAGTRRNRIVGELVDDRRVEVRTRFGDQPLAELVSQQAALELAHLAFGQFAELKRAVGDADQARHVEPERAEHVLDLAVLALAEAERQP